MKIQKKFQGAIPENKIMDAYSSSNTDTYSCNYVNNKINELGFVAGNLTGLNGVTVKYSQYVIIGNIFMLVAELYATQNVGQYYGIAQLSNGSKGVTGNSYIYDKNNKNCYLSKSNGTISIYQSGGFTAGSTLVWAGIYPLNA